MATDPSLTNRTDAKVAAVNAAKGDKDATLAAVESLSKPAPTNRTDAQDSALIGRANAARDAANAGSGTNRTDVASKVAAAVDAANKQGQ